MTKAALLVVEDDAIVAQHLKTLLTNMGYVVIGVTATGEDAIDKARHHLPEVVLMDIRLAGKIDGITAAAEIGKRYQIPIIYLTAHSDEETLARARETRPAGYVLKPFEPRNLYVAIEMALYSRPEPLEKVL